MSYFERAEKVYQLHPIGMAITNDGDYIKAGEIYISQKDLLARYIAGHPIPDFIDPYFTAISVKILGGLGFGFLIKPDFDPQKGLTDQEINKLRQDNYDRHIATGLIHLALYSHKILLEKNLGIKFEGKEKYLKEAEINIKNSSAKVLKQEGMILLDALKNGLYK
ncbi:MAG: hypothetical protein A2V72_02690 [Candidatus Nealsonbacteria bacterium RBG_13_37_56]|uniref:Uncharacterized protein n=1 Tax=Candidatus Nealsonbacteria bacterium RBG_13_37_56 TaxID=1801661 RepID=A0A1G2DXC7_9BACT|nr:MAG: hypothetical protein A2V72_02690 [Candidatus Nealsonbacteria bacterium RBG_13_37_56]HJX46007.1 hypothetical protein [Patescibacteria group bacterium]